MLAFHKEQNDKFAIFGIAPKRMGEVVKLVRKLPHKFLIGVWEGTMEPSCIMPLRDFLPLMDEIGKGETAYLELGEAIPANNYRPATVVYFDTGERVPLNNLFREVPEPPADGNYTFDPAEGKFFVA